MRILLATAFVSLLIPIAAGGDVPVISADKAELMGRVEDFFLHNYRDITWRKSLAWSEVQAAPDGTRSITYSFEARIWDKETMVMKQTFTFAADGKFVRAANETGYPQKKDAPAVDVKTQKGMI